MKPRDGGRPADEHDVHGTPPEILAKLLAFQEAGADEFIVSDDAAGIPAGQALDQIDILTQAVLPRLTTASGRHPRSVGVDKCGQWR